MESKLRKFLKEDNYVHCTICANFSNSNSFAHKKSGDHQKKLKIKLRKVNYFLKQTLKKTIILHDEQWTGRNTERFCHFCGSSFIESHKDEDFIVENLGFIYHHSSTQHCKSVKSFLKKNFSTEAPEKYCISEKDLNSFLSKLPEEKQKYLKKMNILNDMVLRQIKETEEERKRLVNEELQALQAKACCSQETEICTSNTNVKEAKKFFPVLKNKDLAKIPPWLEDVSTDSSTKNMSSAPVIGPTIDTLIKHVANQKRKGLPQNRVGANFAHQVRGSSKWLPSFQGVWNQGRRKQMKISFNRKNKPPSF